MSNIRKTNDGLKGTSVDKSRDSLRNDSFKIVKRSTPGKISPVYTNGSRVMISSQKNPIVIKDKAKKSAREKQEQAMKEIVFDDLNTPHFRQRSHAAEDKTLEEALKKPMTIELDELEAIEKKE